MSFKTTGILALLLAILGGYIYLFEIRGWENKERAEKAAKKITQVKKGQVSRLRLETPGELVSAVKDGFSWKIVSPVETDGDYDMFEGLIHAAGSLEKSGVAADSSQTSLPDFNLADFGLASPAVRLTFTIADGERQEVSFGDRSPTGVYFYVKTSGDDRIYLAESRFYYQFDLSLQDLRDKRYVQFDPDRVQEIELVYGDQKVAVVRDGTHWRMTVPVADAGDDVGIGQFLTFLRDARIETFSDLKDDADTGLNVPWFSINLYEGMDRGLRGVAFGRKAGSRAYRTYLAKNFSSLHVFEADSAFVHELANSGDKFRTRDVFVFNRHEVDRLVMTFPDSSIVFDKRGPNQWEVTSHPNHQIAGSRVEDFVDEIVALRAMSYVSEEMEEDRRAVFETQGIRIRLLGKSKLLREIVVGAFGNHLFATTNDRKQILEIDKYFLGKIRDVRIHPKSNTTQG